MGLLVTRSPAAWDWAAVPASPRPHLHHVALNVNQLHEQQFVADTWTKPLESCPASSTANEFALAVIGATSAVTCS
jgi:hypothetical protein